MPGCDDVVVPPNRKLAPPSPHTIQIYHEEDRNKNISLVDILAC